MADRVRVELQPLGRVLEVARGVSLQSILDEYEVEFPCGGHGACGGCRVRTVRGSLPVTMEQEDILSHEEIEAGWRLACRCTVESDVALEIDQWETVVLADHTHFEFTAAKGFGVAVDLGTTTVVAQLLDLSSGHVLAVRTSLNPQTAYGSDIMNRVHAAVYEQKQGELTAGIRRGIGRLLAELLEQEGRAHAPIDDVTIVGNTVMHHLFCGIDMQPLARAPFEPDAFGPHCLAASALGWPLAGDPAVRFLPCLGGFVGSDILAGILATQMHTSEEPVVLVDLGTNGEIVVGNRDRMLCASTAAGPAFEAGRISMGMRATTGAISEVVAEAGRLCCRVVGGGNPRGICGSGLVDAVAAGLDLGLVLPSGRLAGGRRTLELASPVCLTQQDIRELQLAKGAIAAGLRILRRRFGAEACADPPVYLAGAFGNYVNRASAARIGLIDAPAERIEPAGNTALLGAKMALFDREDDEFRDLRRRVEHVALASDPAFQDIFIAETLFPDGRPTGA